MNEATTNIDLSAYSLEELSSLVNKANKAIAHKERNRVQEIRDEIERLAGDMDMSVEEVIHFDARKKKGGKTTVGKAKFQNPANPEQSWTGRGKRPGWLREALGQGARLEDFAIQS